MVNHYYVRENYIETRKMKLNGALSIFVVSIHMVDSYKLFREYVSSFLWGVSARNRPSMRFGKNSVCVCLCACVRQ